MKNSEIISKHYSDMAKKSHKKNPRSREHYQEMARKSHENSPRSKEHMRNMALKRWGKLEE